jgi:acyl dehydratase
MTDALFAAFQLASGDNHPIHYDAAYCRRLGMPDMPGRTTGVLTMRTEVVNQEGVTVMDGMQKYLLRRRPA